MPSLAFTPLEPAKAVVNCSCNLLPTHLQPTPHMMSLGTPRLHQLADLRPASFRPNLAVWPLPFASSYHLIAILIAKDGDLPTEDFIRGGLRSLVHAHAGRTQTNQSDLKSLRSLCRLIGALALKENFQHIDKKIILGTVAALMLSACNSTPESNVTNYETAGNLEFPKPAGCVSVGGLSNKQNPVDIFTGLNDCLTRKDYTNAANLYFAGMSYGFFDTKRVSDKTAHQAISVLRMNLFGSQPQDVMDKLQVALTSITSDNTAICESLSNLGAPAYKPTYMIQHGMGAFTSQSTKDSLVENFDSEAAWKDALSTIAKCI